jgi:hypothetical protein
MGKSTSVFRNSRGAKGKMATPAEARAKGPATAGRRYNLNLSHEAYQRLEHLSELGGGRTMSEVIRLALGLLDTVYPAVLRGEELYLVDPASNSESKILIPKY